MSSFNGSRTAERPTLPSIHSLDLPFMSRNASSAYDSYEKNPFHSPRKASTSSSTTSMSRSPSPSPPPASPVSTSSASSTRSQKLQLVPCHFEEADAVILVPAPSASATSGPIQQSAPSSAAAAKPLMLVGSALQALRRQPSRQLAKGARMHPYRIVAGHGSLSRRSSMASMVSLPESSS